MGQGDEHVGIHDGPADLGVFHILAALHRDFHLVGALEAVGNDDMTACGVGGKAVDIGGLNMVQSVLPTAHVQGVAVRQEGFSALALHQVGHYLGPVGPQIGQVARLTEVHFNGDEFPLHVNVAEAGGHHQAGQLLGQVFPPTGTAEIRKVDFCFFCHSIFSFFLIIPPRGSRHAPAAPQKRRSEKPVFTYRPDPH